MDKETFLNQLSNELKISKPMLLKYIAMVGTNKENIINYAQNSSCAIVRKDNGFNINYTAKMLNDKDHKIAVLERALEFACKRYWDDCGMEDCPYGENEIFDVNNKKCQSCSDNSGMTENKDGCCWVEFFKSQAEIEIKKDSE